MIQLSKKNLAKKGLHLSWVSFTKESNVGAKKHVVLIPDSEANITPEAQLTFQEHEFPGDVSDLTETEGYIQSEYIAGRRRYIRPTKWQGSRLLSKSGV